MNRRNRREPPDATRPYPEVLLAADHHAGGDVRDLLGMNTRSAYLVAGLYLVSLTADLIVSVGNGSDLLPGLAVLIMVALGAVGLLGIPDDPLPVRYVAAALVCGPIGVYLSFIGTPLPPSGPEQTWQFAALTAVATYMCVRGRAGSAWLLLCLVVGAAMVWTQRYGDGATQGLALGAIGVVFGDIGTSPLYAMREALHHTRATVHGDAVRLHDPPGRGQHLRTAQARRRTQRGTGGLAGRCRRTRQADARTEPAGTADA